MKFTLSTQPLKTALDLTIIPSNVSKFYERSCVVEITAEGDELRINTQAVSITSEACLHGSHDDGNYASAIVDNALFKKLVSSINDSEIGIEFTDNALEIVAGRSRFSVPLLVSDDDGMTLDRPDIDDGDIPFTALHPDIWKYIKDHQLYALSMSMLDDSKVYAYVWSSKDEGVLTGDPENSFFTHQPLSDIDDTCLITPNIVNLLASMDSESKLYKVSENTYVVEVVRDSLVFRAQFNVAHEEDDGYGEYASDVIFQMVFDEVESIEVPVETFTSNIKQASLFSTVADDCVTLRSSEDGVYLITNNANCLLSSQSNGDYEARFLIKDLDTLVSHMDGRVVELSPVIKEGDVSGIRLKSGDLVSLLGGLN